MDRFAALFFMGRDRPNDGVRLSTITTEGEGMTLSGDEHRHPDGRSDSVRGDSDALGRGPDRYNEGQLRPLVPVRENRPEMTDRPLPPGALTPRPTEHRDQVVGDPPVVVTIYNSLLRAIGSYALSNHSWRGGLIAWTLKRSIQSLAFGSYPPSSRLSSSSSSFSLFSETR